MSLPESQRARARLLVVAAMLACCGCQGGCFLARPDWCFDGEASIDETGVDCGGPTCEARCPTGAACVEDADCTSRLCRRAVCSEPACDDGLRNGAESDVDCGGACPPCGADRGCMSHADCVAPLWCTPATKQCGAVPIVPNAQGQSVGAAAGRLSSGRFDVVGGVGQVGDMAGPVIRSGGFSIAGTVAGAQR